MAGLVERPLHFSFCHDQNADARNLTRYYSSFLASHQLAISPACMKSTSSPQLCSHRIILSTMPMTWAIPEVSGCKMIVNIGSFSCSRIQRNRSFHICSIVRTSTYPCELWMCGKYCIGVISSIYQFPGISTNARRSRVDR